MSTLAATDVQRLISKFGDVHTIRKDSAFRVTRNDKKMVVLMKFSRRYKPGKLTRYWWTFNRHGSISADWVFLLCEDMDGMFALPQADFQPKGDRWHLNLSTDRKTIFNFSGPGLNLRDGTVRYVPAEHLETFIAEHLYQPQFWHENANSLRRSPGGNSGTLAPSYTPPNHRHLAILLHNLVSSEKSALTHLASYVRDSGFIFEWETLVRFHVSLKTKPLVILSGLSGSGKSKLPHLYARALGLTVESFPVSPAWTSDSDLLGYYNPVRGSVVTTPLFDFLVRAMANPNGLFLCVLDEMNVARVEYYFSQFLSVLEQFPDHRVVRLPGSRISVKLGTNVKFIGTVNSDETVHPFSNKVLDRADVVNFDFVDVTRRPQVRPVSTIRVTTAQFELWSRNTVTVDIRPLLGELNLLLRECNMHFGFRVVNEVELWVDNATGLVPTEDALDMQIQQRILTKVRGPVEPRTNTMLTALQGFFAKHKLRRCLKSVIEKQEQAKHGFIP